MTVTNGYSDIQEFSDVITTDFQVKFESAINQGAALYNDLLTVVTSDGLGAHIPFIDHWEGLDDIELNEQPTSVTTVPISLNENFGRKAKMLQISATSWMNPGLQSLMTTQINALAAEAAYSRGRSIAAILNDGETVPSYDIGQGVFSQTHSLNGVTFSNLLIGNPLTPDGFQAARTVLETVPLGPEGDGLPVSDMLDYTIVIPPALRFTAETLFNQGLLPAGSYANTVGNVLKSAAKIIVSPLLDDPNDWYLIATLAGIKPFVTVRAANSNPALIPLLDETMPHVYELNLYRWVLNLFEETHAVHYYQMVKCTNS
jgi:hypothetical protein